MDLNNPTSLEEIKSLFDSAIPVRNAAPLDERDVKLRVQEAERELTKIANESSDLLDSAFVVFEQQRYYDVTRLFLYAEYIYDNLCKKIDEADIPLVVKEALPDFSTLGFPRSLDVDLPAKSVKTSVFNKGSYLMIEIELAFYPNNVKTFITHVRY